MVEPWNSWPAWFSILNFPFTTCITNTYVAYFEADA